MSTKMALSFMAGVLVTVSAGVLLLTMAYSAERAAAAARLLPRLWAWMGKDWFGRDDE